MCRCTKDIAFHVYESMLILFQVDSVDLAMKLLDGYDHRGHKLHVERAKFQMKGNFDPSLKLKKQKKKGKERLNKMQEKYAYSIKYFCEFFNNFKYKLKVVNVFLHTSLTRCIYFSHSVCSV
jgi:hypothetical protein